MFSRFKINDKANTYFVKKDMMPQESSYKNFHLLFVRLMNRIKISDSKRLYEKNTCLVKLGIKYVFVALHYQPEETSCPAGGIYVDQLLILEMLDLFLDQDITIYVKEHRSQLNTSMEEGAAGRSRSFYNRLFNISSRVKIISADTDPFLLIDNAIATVTISGTVGWESVVRGTPSLVFGRAWYEGMPGVFRVADYGDLERAWPNVLRMKEEGFSKALLDSHRRLSGILVYADLYKAFSRPLRVAENESVANLVENIKGRIALVDGGGCA
ncbi:MAG: hypothetical protein R2864_10305 [Syntrophotaleaceae bacterium]